MAGYFIKIEDGPDVRRKLLESSKASLQVLKIYQQLVITRGQKLSLIGQLRRELKEITVLLNLAESMMPVLSDKEIEEMAPKRPLPRLESRVPEVTVVPKAKRPAIYAGPPTRKSVLEVPLPSPQLSAAPEPLKLKPKMTELERLESQLAAVEGRLSRL